MSTESTIEPPPVTPADPAVTAQHPPPWLFALSGMPYGVVGSFAGNVMPNLAREAHIEMGSIGWYGVLLLVPPMLQFLYAPIVDVGPSRRHWLVLVSMVGAACLLAALLMPLPTHTHAFLAFALAAQLITGLVGACNGGLLAATMPDHVRGRASAALNIGNLSGGAVSAAILIYMNGRVEPIYMGLTCAAMMVLPSLAILSVVEPPRVARNIADVFGTLFADIREVLFTKSGVTGVLMCLSPVGTVALNNYLSAMAVDYKASQLMIALVSGPASAALSAVGALLGGWICDRYNRRVMYLLSGVLTAICTAAMALASISPVTYAIGGMTYALITGFAYCAFTAVVLETVGKGGRAAATQYSLFVAAGNAAINYSLLVDSRFSDAYGNRGVCASDSVINIAGVVVLGLVFWRLGSFGHARIKTKLAADGVIPAELPKATARKRDS